jgi:hypothetical protein
VIALLAMTLNHFLKTLIGNPRPFVADENYPRKWAISAENMRELAQYLATCNFRLGARFDMRYVQNKG